MGFSGSGVYEGKRRNNTPACGVRRKGRGVRRKGALAACLALPA
jgi:hypothetical protein